MANFRHKKLKKHGIKSIVIRYLVMNNNNYKCEISEYFKQLDFEYCEKNIEGLKELLSHDIEINAILEDLEKAVVKYYK